MQKYECKSMNARFNMGKAPRTSRWEYAGMLMYPYLGHEGRGRIHPAPVVSPSPPFALIILNFEFSCCR
jgi:hypothetical protein